MKELSSMITGFKVRVYYSTHSTEYAVNIIMWQVTLVVAINWWFLTPTTWFLHMNDTILLMTPFVSNKMALDMFIKYCNTKKMKVIDY